MKSVLITGASSGIGEAITLRLAGAHWRVFAGVRSDDDASKLQEKNSRIVPIRLDVTKPSDIEKAAERISGSLDGGTLAGLVNNAGIAQMGPLTVQPMDEIRAHFEVNALGAIAVCQAIAPLLGQDRSRRGEPGRIVNIPSLGGLVASPYANEILALAESKREEMFTRIIDAVSDYFDDPGLAAPMECWVVTAVK